MKLAAEKRNEEYFNSKKANEADKRFYLGGNKVSEIHSNDIHFDCLVRSRACVALLP